MNVELAMAAIEDAKANPDNFEMSVWMEGFPDGYTKSALDDGPPCGSTACYAGFVALRAAPAGSVVRNLSIIPPNGMPAPVWWYAETALGITVRQANALFMREGIEEVERAVKYLADNPDATPESIRLAALDAL